MSDEIKDQVNPEEFWPAAEQLLDQHFQQKKRRRAAWLFALLLLCTSVGVLTLYKKEVSTVKKSDAPAVKPAMVQANATNNSVATTTPPAQESAISNNDNSTASTPKTTDLQLHTAQSEKANSMSVMHTQLRAHHTTKQQHVNASFAVIAPVATTQESSATSAEQSQSSVVAESVPLSDVEMLLSLQPHFETSADFSLAGIPAPKKSKHYKKPLSLIVYGGAAAVGKTIDAGNGKVYLQRRSKEEERVVLPFAGMQLSRTVGKVDVRIGFEATMLGEKLNYSPYSIGEYYNTRGEWQPYQRTVTHVDSTYIFGVIFTHTTTTQVADSNYVLVTDTLNGSHYDASITRANGVNRRLVIEVPVEAVWQLAHGRFGIGLMGGIAPGLLVKSTGHYLLPDESGTGDLSKDSKQQFTLNIRTGIEFSYLLSERMRIVLRPAARFYLLDVDEKTGAGSKYHSYGVSAGVSYSIR